MIPDGMPRLSKGNHASPHGGMCVMEYISLLKSEPVFSDTPRCTDRRVRVLAWRANDEMSDEGRQRLLNLVPALMECGPIVPDDVPIVTHWDVEKDLEDVWMWRVGRKMRTMRGDDDYYDGLAAVLEQAERIRPKYAHLWVGKNPEVPKILLGASTEDVTK